MKLREAMAALLCTALMISGCNAAAAIDKTDETKQADFSRADIKDIRPQDDFYGYVNLNTLKGLSIAPGESAAGAIYSSDIDEDLQAKIKEIATGSENYEKGSCEDIIRKAYNAYLDYDSNDENKKASAKIIESDIQKIMDCNDLNELKKVSSDVVKKYPISPLGNIGISTNDFDPDQYSIIWAQSRNILGLDLDEISKDTSKAEKGEMMVIDSLMAAGVDHDTAEKTAHDLMYKVIDIAWATDKDILNGVNNFPQKFMSEEEINKLLTNSTAKDIEEWCAITSNPYGGWIVYDPGQIKAYDGLLVEENLEILKAWYVTELVTSFGEYMVIDHPELGKYFPMSGLDFDTRAYYFLNIYYPMELSDLYVKYLYTDEMDAKLMEMCNDIIEGYRVLINDSDWLSEEARKSLELKLDNITFLTGKTVKENMKNNSEKADSFKSNLAETLIASNELTYNELIGNLGKTRDRSVIGMSMQTVNACYSSDNTVTITAAIMTDPWFDVDNPYYENLGGLGTVVAHEIGHGFDSNLIKFNENGVLDPDWLPENDLKLLEERNNAAVEYFENSFNVFEIYSVDGDNTLGENYADLGGMEAVMSTCELLKASDDDYKTVFESYGRLWCALMSDEGIINQLAFDSHSPSEIRTNAILATTEKFYEVYDVKEGDGMYIAPEKRIGRWK
ncbi:MAG: M13 family metallopeptidase [Clostridia bacterium]|nr:M13 family metallopeptidase [Clostridia bacterium]